MCDLSHIYFRFDAMPAPHGEAQELRSMRVWGMRILCGGIGVALS